LGNCLDRHKERKKETKKDKKKKRKMKRLGSIERETNRKRKKDGKK